MALFVHLAPANAVGRVRRAGIRRGQRGVFCLPVLPDYTVTHQWARELRRRGMRTVVAVTFWLADDEPVSVGLYHRPHQQLPAVEATRLILAATLPLGYEVIVPRAIGPDELRAIRPVSRTVGWRYLPNAHGQRPCLCDWCSRGDIKRQRQRRYQERQARRRV
jgi:hypothetical protein